MNREESWELLCEWTESDSLRKHMLGVEAASDAIHYVAPVGEKEEYVARRLANIAPHVQGVFAPAGTPRRIGRSKICSAISGMPSRIAPPPVRTIPEFSAFS